MLGTALKFLGVPIKWGLRLGGGAVGVSLLGYASEWFKNTIVPPIKKFLFGEKDENGNVTKKSLVGRLWH